MEVATATVVETATAGTTEPVNTTHQNAQTVSIKTNAAKIITVSVQKETMKSALAVKMVMEMETAMAVNMETETVMETEIAMATVSEITQTIQITKLETTKTVAAGIKTAPTEQSNSLNLV